MQLAIKTCSVCVLESVIGHLRQFKMFTGRQVDTSCRLFEPVGMHLIDGNPGYFWRFEHSVVHIITFDFLYALACMLIIPTACMVFSASQTDYITLTLAFRFADMDGNSVKWGFKL